VSPFFNLLCNVLTIYSNPKDYNDNLDARQFDSRLRGPIRPIELEIDPNTGMKNYIANTKGDWATSVAFVKYSFERSIHHGRLYTNGHGFFKGKDEDLAEALRLLGQGLHCLEDFGAHSNYTELALREQGYHNVFCHVGSATQINLRGKQVYPLITGTFGTVDFIHSVLGEANDHFSQSEVNEMDNALGTAQTAAQSSNPITTLIKLLSKVPGTRELCAEAEQLQRSSNQYARELGMPVNESAGWYQGSRGMDDTVSSRGIDEGTSRSGADYPGASYEQSRVSQPDYSMPQAVYPDQQHGGWSQPPQQPQQLQWNAPQHPQSFNMATTGAYPSNPPQYHEQGGFQPPQYEHQTAPWEQQSSQSNFGVQNEPPQPQWNQKPQAQQSQGFSVPQQQITPDLAPQSTPSAPQQMPSSAPEGLPGMPNFDAAKTIQQIYPILAFRDKVVRTISAIIEKIPGLEALVDRITETLTVFILSLLAPFVRPILTGITKALQSGSGAVVDASGQHQFEPWTDPSCSDPTHSLLSKDHFSNVLNCPAGNVASAILTYIAPRVLYAWEHPDVPLSQIDADVEKVFHHPAIRDRHSELHNNMFSAVEKWARSSSMDINNILSSESVRAGKNHVGEGGNPHISGQAHTPHTQPQRFNAMPGGQQSHSAGGAFDQIGDMISSLTSGSHGSQGQQQHSQSSGGIGGLLSSFTGGGGGGGGGGGHQSSSGGMGQYLDMASHLPIPGVQGVAQTLNKYSKYANMIPGGIGKRELDPNDAGSYREVGGRRELMEAEARAERGDQISRGTSPLPPSGYEDYAGRSEYRPSDDVYGEGERYGQRGYGGGY
jgi:uncharacterized membrane protein YgcG